MPVANSAIAVPVEIPKHEGKGFLCVAECGKDIPFVIKRIYYIAGANDGEARGGHAHRRTRQFLFCIQGCIEIVLDNGKNKQKVDLKAPNQGILLDKMVWHEMRNFKANTVLMVVASRRYSKRDYIRNYQEFKSLVDRDDNSRSI